jgi:pilus assembly protein CpaE
LLQSIVISPNEQLRNRLVAALEANGHVTIARSMDHYPSLIDLVRTLRAHATEILFVDFESSEKALAIVALLEKEGSHVQIAAIHQHMDPAVLQQLMRAGVREFLTEPFTRPAVAESLAQMKSILERRPVNYEATNQIFSFLPSKAGVGTSTIALNMSAAMARDAGTKVLLADFDLNSGMMRFMLKLTNKNSVQDAVERSDEMDEQLWPQMVTEVARMDVLHGGGVRPNLRIEPAQIRSLIEFVRRHYQVLCFDLSGNLEKYSIELMHESKRILLVCTPEIPSLHLTREKLAFLRECDVASRVSIIVNRMHKKSQFSKQQVEKMLDHPVAVTIPNDYHAINEALAAGTVLAPGSSAGKSITEFAESILQQPQPKRRGDKHKFLEQFFVPSPKLLTPSGGD